jgi:Cu-Zn family superoxide dismutase
VKRASIFFAALFSMVCWNAHAAKSAEVLVKFYAVDEKGTGQYLGAVDFKDTHDGLMITPALAFLPPGLHGFHVHENPVCSPKKKDGKMMAGGAAGGHYDPAKTGKHSGPKGSGHMGDLPAMDVGDAGLAITQTFAPRLKVADLMGRSIIIHAGGDNYADQPAPMGGGGARIACGVVPR